MVIELAPNWKRSLTLTNPLMLASGGHADASNVGAVVTLPTTLRPRAGSPPPRFVEIAGGALMRSGAANPGLSNVLRDVERRRAWDRPGNTVPLIVACSVQGARDWEAMASQLDRASGVGGIELHLNPTMDAAEAIRAVRAATELPILAKLDLEDARDIAGACIAAGANALVIGRPPRGMRVLDGRVWSGRLLGPAAKPFALCALAEIAEMKLGAPLVACGGVHSADDVREFLAAGACAVEIDSAVWADPSIVARIAAEIGAAA